MSYKPNLYFEQCAIEISENKQMYHFTIKNYGPKIVHDVEFRINSSQTPRLQNMIGTIWEFPPGKTHTFEIPIFVDGSSPEVSEEYAELLRKFNDNGLAIITHFYVNYKWMGMNFNSGEYTGILSKEEGLKCLGPNFDT